ncbi:MAG: hypothetical protein C0424_12430 [Sphingobacteriaceae bacterium]|nr:hypothetical protein [Sphingobacteriaceae bacterium]
MTTNQRIIIVILLLLCGWSYRMLYLSIQTGPEWRLLVSSVSALCFTALLVMYGLYVRDEMRKKK